MTMTESRRKTVLMVVLATILLTAFAVRAYRVSDPIGGYHSFNEGFYSKIAAEDAQRSPVAWFTEPADENNPPVYSAVLALLFMAFGESLALARMVSVVAGVATVYYTFLLGKTLYTEKIGLLAAALLALTPGFALVNHNIQVDSLMLFFCIAGIYHYVRAIPGDDRKQAAIAGVLMGLAIATKLPAVLAPFILAVWETWRTRGVGWLRTRRVLPFLAGLFVLALPWYLLRVISAGGAFFARQAALSNNAAALDSWLEFRWEVANEILWMLSPVLTVLGVAALGYLAFKRAAGDRLVLTGATVYLAFFLVYNFHSYYIVPLAPFIALAVARGTFALARKVPQVVWVHAAIIPFLLLATMMTFAGSKYGLWSPAQVAQTIPVPLAEATIYDSAEIAGSYQPAIEYSLRPAKVIQLPDEFYVDDMPVAETGGTYLLTSLEPNVDSGAPQSLAVYSEKETSVVAFGVKFTQVAINRHFFGNGVWRAEWVGAPYFGIVEKQLEVKPGDTAIHLYDVKVLLEQMP